MTVPARTFPTCAFKPVATSAVPRRTARAERVPSAALEARGLGHVDGAVTVGEIAARLGLAEVECASLIVRLVDLGCVTIDAQLDSVDDRETVPGIQRRSPSDPRRTRSGKRRRLAPSR